MDVSYEAEVCVGVGVLVWACWCGRVGVGSVYTGAERPCFQEMLGGQSINSLSFPRISYRSKPALRLCNINTVLQQRTLPQMWKAGERVYNSAEGQWRFQVPPLV